MYNIGCYENNYASQNMQGRINSRSGKTVNKVFPI